MIDWTASSRIKVARANEHISNLAAEIGRFLENRPYCIEPDDDKETGDRIFRVNVLRKDAESLDPRWGAIVGDAVHNMRSALDVLIHNLVLAEGFTPTDKLSFPFFESRNECESQTLGEIKRANEVAVRKIKALKPYPLGNEPLWFVRVLNNADKHRMLTPVGNAFAHVRTNLMTKSFREASTEMFGESPPDFFISLKPADNLYPQPLKDGTILYRIAAAVRDEVLDMRPEFTFTISFGESEVTKGKPVLPTLHQMAAVVSGIIEDFSTLTLAPRTKKRPRGE